LNRTETLAPMKTPVALLGGVTWTTARLAAAGSAQDEPGPGPEVDDAAPPHPVAAESAAARSAAAQAREVLPRNESVMAIPPRPG
jgi:hypothetical protein